MSNAQKEMLAKFSATLEKLPEKDQAYLLGRAEGMAEANERHNNETKKQTPPS